MRHGAKNLINLAFAQICADENLEPCPEAFEWEPGEAEQWILQIVHSGKYLSWSFTSDDKASPCLRS